MSSLVSIPSRVTSRRLLPQEYDPIASEYLRTGRRTESWHINWVEWDGDRLQASASLLGGVASRTDDDRFHLSIFSVREMESQLGIIGAHLKLNLAEKKAEVWLLRCIEECLASIDEPNDVFFDLNFKLRKTSKGKVLIERSSQIRGAKSGLISLNVMSLMDWHDSMGPLDDRI